MRLPHLVKFVLVCGALVALPGPTVHAQAANSTRFVKVLLLDQQAGIQADNKALAMLQSDIAKLGSATSSRQIKSLSKTISRLNRKILIMTSQLNLLSIQTYNSARALTPKNSSLVAAALSSLMMVQ